MNENPIPREALKTDAIEALPARAELATVEMPPLLRAQLTKQPTPPTPLPSPPRATVPPPTLTGTPWEPPAVPVKPPTAADFSYPRHPGTPVWHYLVLGAALASLVLVALSILTSLGFVSLGHH